MATTTTAPVAATPISPAASMVQPFVQENHDNVVKFLTNFNPAPFVNPTIPLEANEFKKTNLIASLVFGLAAAYAYSKTPHKYVALGLGIISVASLLTSYVKTPIPAFKEFLTNCDLAAAHLTNAWRAKGEFMVDQVNGKTYTWKIGHDITLAGQYDTNNNSSIDLTKITETQKAWRVVHKTLADTVGNLSPLLLEPKKDGNPHLNAALAKVSIARDLILNGRSPVAPLTAHFDEKTYVQYNVDKTASMWPLPKV